MSGPAIPRRSAEDPERSTIWPLWRLKRAIRPVEPRLFRRPDRASGIAERFVLTYRDATDLPPAGNMAPLPPEVTSLPNPAESFTLADLATTKEIEPFAAR